MQLFAIFLGVTFLAALGELAEFLPYLSQPKQDRSAC